jgi:signal transduction histidine kinase
MPGKFVTARGRLTILYTALVLAAGLVLTGLTYLLMQRNLGRRLSVVIVGTNAGPVPLPPDPGEIAAQVRNLALGEFLAQAAIALVVVTVLAAVLGWLVAGRVLRPIRSISATARRLSAENLSERMPVSTPADELTALAGTINGMLDRIQQGIAERDRVLQSQRMFTANAAHELRTPLTTMRTAIDVTLDGEPTNAELLAMTSDIRTAVEHSQRTLDGLLSLARSQAAADARQVDLADVLTHVLGNAAGELRGLTVQADLKPAVISGEPILLERMAGNLVDNAIRYNHDGGHIEITTGSTDTQVFLRISNTGGKVTSDRLLEPFVRGEGARLHTDTGVGLGLSIVQAIVTAHRGEISITARPAGGLHIDIRLTNGLRQGKPIGGADFRQQRVEHLAVHRVDHEGHREQGEAARDHQRRHRGLGLADRRVAAGHMTSGKQNANDCTR